MTADRSSRSTTRKQPARGTAAKKKAPARAVRAQKLATLAIDVGGTGLKASVLDPAGAMEVDRVRVATSYPCPPTKLVETLDALFFYDQIYVGGGNSKHVTADLGPKATIVDNAAGILGGIKLWERQ